MLSLSKDNLKLSSQTDEAAPDARLRVKRCQHILKGYHYHSIRNLNGDSFCLEFLEAKYRIWLYDKTSSKSSCFEISENGVVTSSVDRFIDPKRVKPDQTMSPSSVNIDVALDDTLKKMRVDPSRKAPHIPIVQDRGTVKKKGWSFFRLANEASLALWLGVSTVNGLVKLFTLRKIRVTVMNRFFDNTGKSILCKNGFILGIHSGESDEGENANKRGLVNDSIASVHSLKETDSVLGRIGRKISLLYSPAHLIGDGCVGSYIPSRDWGPRGVVIGRRELTDLVRTGRGTSATLHHEIWHWHVDELIFFRGKPPLFSGWQSSSIPLHLPYLRYMGFDEITACSTSLYHSARALRERKIPLLASFKCYSDAYRLASNSLIGLWACGRALKTIKQEKHEEMMSKQGLLEFFVITPPRGRRLLQVTVNAKSSGAVTIFLGQESVDKFEKLMHTGLEGAKQSGLAASLMSDVKSKFLTIQQAAWSIHLEAVPLAICGGVLGWIPYLSRFVAGWALALHSKIREIDSVGDLKKSATPWPTEIAKRALLRF